MQEKLFNTHNLARIAILSTVAFLLMFIEFPMPFIAPAFYQMDFSEVPVLIGGFAIAPWAAIVIELLKNLLNILFEGSSTAFIGELSNFIVGSALTFTAALIYHRHKTKKQAMIALFVGTLVMAAVGYFCNLYLIIPAYMTFMGIPQATIIGMAQAIFPFINSLEMMVLLCAVPFNLIKGIILSVITALIYKAISPLLRRV